MLVKQKQCLSLLQSIEHNTSIEFNLNKQPLEIVTNEKLLGVLVDQHLTWKYQVEKTIKKCNSMLYLLLRIKFFLDIHSRKLFYNAYILPHLDYCSTIWGNCSDHLKNELIKIQKRAARIILDRPVDSPSADLFKQLKWMTFPERVDYKKAICIFKSLQSDNIKCPSYILNKFQFVNDTRLRSSHQKLLKVPKPNMEFYRNSLNYSGPKLWNDIPLDIRSCRSEKQFKDHYLKWKFPCWDNSS